MHDWTKRQRSHLTQRGERSYINIDVFRLWLPKHSSSPTCTKNSEHMRYKLLCEGHVLMVRVDLRVSLCGQQHPNRERAISSHVFTFLCELNFSSNPTNKNLTDLRLDTDTVTSQTIYRSSWITLYKSSLRPNNHKLFTCSIIFILLTFVLLSFRVFSSLPGRAFHMLS
jgi:hypothetical protein